VMLEGSEIVSKKGAFQNFLAIVCLTDTLLHQ
jgi:hypothetical protein